MTPKFVSNLSIIIHTRDETVTQNDLPSFIQFIKCTWITWEILPLLHKVDNNNDDRLTTCSVSYYAVYPKVPETYY